MGKAIDLTDERFGRLVVLRQAPNKGKERRWHCRCDCGNEPIISTISFRHENTKSCGCLQRETVGAMARTHGMSNTPTYKVWTGIKSRCGSPRHKNYADYGGRGITVCARWKDSFENFLADMGERPKGMTIERIDGNGNYEPGNCIWATRLVQARNRRSTHILNVCGREMCLAEAAELYGLHRRTIRDRLEKGWDVMTALRTPVQKMPPRVKPQV